MEDQHYIDSSYGTVMWSYIFQTRPHDPRSDHHISGQVHPPGGLLHICHQSSASRSHGLWSQAQSQGNGQISTQTSDIYWQKLDECWLFDIFSYCPIGVITIILIVNRNIYLSKLRIYRVNAFCVLLLCSVSRLMTLRRRWRPRIQCAIMRPGNSCAAASECLGGISEENLYQIFSPWGVQQ